VAEDAVFCKGCGMRLSRKACRSCGKSNDADARFCDQCGGRLDA
jgi:predicted amidophosphoribosyltransferase